MTTQADFFIDHVAHARASDPETSKMAAAKHTPMKLRGSQARVLAAFRLYGDMHDKELVARVQELEKSNGLKPQSESGIRSRRSELSKPNMDRMKAMKDEQYTNGRQRSAENERMLEAWVRLQLRVEGFRSPLWDTGERVVVDGHSVVVWGIAK